MYQINRSEESSSNVAEQNSDYKNLFAPVSSLTDGGLLVSEALKKKFSRILGAPKKTIELSHHVKSNGVDSLVAVELRS